MPFLKRNQNLLQQDPFVFSNFQYRSYGNHCDELHVKSKYKSSVYLDHDIFVYQNKKARHAGMFEIAKDTMRPMTTIGG